MSLPKTFLLFAVALFSLGASGLYYLNDTVESLDYSDTKYRVLTEYPNGQSILQETDSIHDIPDITNRLILNFNTNENGEYELNYVFQMIPHHFSLSEQMKDFDNYIISNKDKTVLKVFPNRFYNTDYSQKKGDNGFVTHEFRFDTVKNIKLKNNRESIVYLENDLLSSTIEDKNTIELTLPNIHFDCNNKRLSCQTFINGEKTFVTWNGNTLSFEDKNPNNHLTFIEANSKKVVLKRKNRFNYDPLKVKVKYFEDDENDFVNPKEMDFTLSKFGQINLTFKG